ncbi:glycosyltransferase family 39 protein, partial [Immundisolibacter sp.]|uniref:ArnT family glycosyltransferase n=1 Tax=Immundisolibacter sp. TaxID=1934948 RepID=UPI00260186ED
MDACFGLARRCWPALALTAGLGLLMLASRPLLPVDETRYLSVAWEMWLRGDFIVPHKNFAVYVDKPPLLFWLMQAGWAVFGVNEWWPRLVPTLAALASLLLTARLAGALWPQRPRLAGLAPWLLATMLL